MQAQINALSALLEKERQREAELELELARLKHANAVDEMLELQVTDFGSAVTAFQGGMFKWVFPFGFTCCLLTVSLLSVTV